MIYVGVAAWRPGQDDPAPTHTNMNLSISKISMPTRFMIGILLIVVISLGIFTILMSPPSGELALMALFLGITAFVSALAGYAAYRFGWINLSPTLHWTILGGYALASILTRRRKTGTGRFADARPGQRTR